MHFPLHPETPAESISLEKLFAGRDIDLDDMYQRMKGLMDAEGLPYGQRTHTYNSRLAQELGKWADATEPGSTIHDALNHAYFVDGRNIGEVPELLSIADNQGLNVDQAREMLEQRTFKDAVDADWARSRALGVTGVPTFVAGGYGVVGAQPYETLVELVSQAQEST